MASTSAEQSNPSIHPSPKPSIHPSNNPSIHSPSPEFADLLEHLELQTEHAQAFAGNSPDVFLKAAMNIAAINFFTLLNRFDTTTLSKRLKQKPELFFQLINSQATLMSASLAREKFEFKKKQTEARQREREQKLRTRKPILITGATFARFNQSITSSRRPEEAELPSVSRTDARNPEPRTLNSEPFTTANTGPTALFEVDTAVFHRQPERIPDPSDSEPEEVAHPWCDPCTEKDLVCCPS